MASRRSCRDALIGSTGTDRLVPRCGSQRRERTTKDRFRHKLSSSATRPCIANRERLRGSPAYAAPELLITGIFA